MTSDGVFHLTVAFQEEVERGSGDDGKSCRDRARDGAKVTMHDPPSATSPATTLSCCIPPAHLPVRFGAIDRELSQHPPRPITSPAVPVVAQSSHEHLWGQQIPIGSIPIEDDFFVA